VFDVTVLNEVFWKRRNTSHIYTTKENTCIYYKIKSIIIRIIPWKTDFIPHYIHIECSYLTGTASVIIRSTKILITIWVGT
jgi:hypothetical protein